MDGRPAPLDLRDLQVISVLGRGAKGVVFLVRDGSSDRDLALKAIARSTVEKKIHGDDGYRRIWFERDVLSALRHPLLPELHGFVSTDKIVGFAIDRCSGGDLNALRKRQTEKMFSDEIIRFYAAELVLALEHLHGLGIMYRDLKPENILIQGSGHLMLVDFDLSARLPAISSDAPQTPSRKSENHHQLPVSGKQRWFPRWLLCKSGIPRQVNSDFAAGTEGTLEDSSEKLEKSNSFVGTEEYVAPEIILGSGHNFAVDWWSLGVVLYEMLYGRTPFRGQNRKETFYRILCQSPELVGERTPLRELIGRLLEKDPRERISCEGIKGHEFFRGVDWDSVLGISRPPYIPVGADEEQQAEAIDVEKFVQGVFGNAGVGKETIPGDLSNNNKEGNWVEALSNPSQTANFLVF